MHFNTIVESHGHSAHRGSITNDIELIDLMHTHLIL